MVDQNVKKNVIISKIKIMDINNVIDKTDVEYIIEECKRLEENSRNQYFYDIVSDLEYKRNSIVDDLYIIDDLEKIKSFLKHTM